jgi:hypothetical protein
LDSPQVGDLQEAFKCSVEKAAQEGIVYTEAQFVALKAVKRERGSLPHEIEAEHPRYLLSQDTVYVGYSKQVVRIYQQTVIDTYSSVTFAQVYTAKIPVTAADMLNDRVLPFFEEQHPVLGILTDRRREFSGASDRHPRELYQELNEIEHTKAKAKAKCPQGNAISERVHQTILNELYRVTSSKKVYSEREALQLDLDE